MAIENEADLPVQRSHLFMLRLWPEDLGTGQTDWRGKVQHVNSGEVRYFRDWPTLEAFVQGLLRPEQDTGTRSHAGRGDTSQHKPGEGPPLPV